MSHNPKIYGLHSYTDPQKAWEVITSDWEHEAGIQILHDKNFERAIIEQAIIGIAFFSNKGFPIIEKLEDKYSISDFLSSYLTDFNFFLYSEKSGKFYTSIVYDGNKYYDGDYTEDELNIFLELSSLYNFKNLLSKAVKFIRQHLSMFTQYDVDIAWDKLIELYWGVCKINCVTQ